MKHQGRGYLTIASSDPHPDPSRNYNSHSFYRPCVGPARRTFTSTTIAHDTSGKRSTHTENIIIPEIEVSEDDHVGRSGARQRGFQGVLYDPQLRHSVLHRSTGAQDNVERRFAKRSESDNVNTTRHRNKKPAQASGT